jgi:hypothetical protein
MSAQHLQFPGLTPKARAAFDVALGAITSTKATISLADLRRALAACLREAMEQATDHDLGLRDELQAIADNLHVPPPPPTLAQARAADLETQEGRDVARAFLATLGEGVQP